MSLKTSPVDNDPWMRMAREEIFYTYGDSVEFRPVSNALGGAFHMHGFNRLGGGARRDLQILPTGIDKETYPTTNLITSIVADSGLDMGTVRLEGYSIDSGDLTYVSQDVTLNGTTIVTLATPLARAIRMVGTGASALADDVAVHEDDTATGGVPDTPAGVHLQTDSTIVNPNHSAKAAIATASDEYAVVTGLWFDMPNFIVTYSNAILTVREGSDVHFQDRVMMTAGVNMSPRLRLAPYLIVPPNSDIVLQDRSNTSDVDVSGGFQGVKLKIY